MKSDGCVGLSRLTPYMYAEFICYKEGQWSSGNTPNLEITALNPKSRKHFLRINRSCKNFVSQMM